MLRIKLLKAGRLRKLTAVQVKRSAERNVPKSNGTSNSFLAVSMLQCYNCSINHRKKGLEHIRRSRTVIMDHGKYFTLNHTNFL